jgi:hypothetical protein
MPRGGAREGAGRPKKTDTAPIAALFELAIGQSSVELALDSKGQVKPSVHVYHRDPQEAARLAQEQFDALIMKYVAQPADVLRRAAEER